MNDSDQSSAAALRPHRPEGDSLRDTAGEPEPPSPTASRPTFWTWIRNQLNRSGATLRDDLHEALQQASGADGHFTDGERAMLANVLKLADMRIEDVMVPRADIEAVDIADSLGDAIQCLKESGHSRVPVYDDTLDHILGMIHIKDALLHLTVAAEKPNGSPIKLVSPPLKAEVGKLDLLRKVLFVPPSMPVSDLLQKMQATRVHMAIVVDEYGGTDGLVTIEDLIEAVVGDIEDEHDDADEVLVRRESENVYRADARASLEELQEVIGRDFDPGEISEDADTLGGLVFSLIDRVPVRGEVITRMKGFEFEILQADARRIRKVRITRRPRGLKVRQKQRAGEPSMPEAAEDSANARDAAE